MYFGSHHGKRFALSDSKEACPLLGEEACPSFELVTVRHEAYCNSMERSVLKTVEGVGLE